MRSALQALARSAKLMDLLPAATLPLAKVSAETLAFNNLAASFSIRARMMRAALRAAMPLRSAPDEAAVGEVLGTLSVRVAVIATWATSIPKTSATTCATLTYR